MSAYLVVIAAAIAALSGAAGLRSARGSAALAVLSAIVGLMAVARYGDGSRIEWYWAVPGGEIAIEVDALSAVFLAPMFVVSALGAVYGVGYWTRESAPRVRAFYGVLTASLALVFVAKNGLFFLAAWELMALSAYALVTTEERIAEVRAAGWLYLVATHTGTLVLFAMFTVLHAASATWTIAPLAHGIADTPLGWAIFGLALAGFGIKAGLMPFHVWLPPAHAAAPSHVSALMSGVLIKTGVYGIARVTTLFPDPPAHWGSIVLGLGAVSAVLGVVFALGQHDLKRLLAYHSIENIGIIAMGIGLGLIGRALGERSWMVLGFSAGFFHVVNHALFKSLLFYGAGAVHHATGTREMDRLGGLARKMPITAATFAAGAAAICGLPPLNGFVSELLLYLGLAGAFGRDGMLGAGFSVASLALVGALALACFVKAFGVVFLGEPRTSEAARAHEAPRTMTIPMIALAACCLAIGLGAPLIAPWAAPPDVRAELAPLAPFSLVGGALLFIVAALASFVAMRSRPAHSVTWDCGYAAPTARMQYTSSSFADTIVRLFGWVLWPKRHAPDMKALFAGKRSYESHVPDTVLDRALAPALAAVALAARWARWIQPKYLPIYLLYVAITLVVLLARV